MVAFALEKMNATVENCVIFELLTLQSAWRKCKKFIL